jgi:hypothetical protein
MALRLPVGPQEFCTPDPPACHPDNAATPAPFDMRYGLWGRSTAAPIEAKFNQASARTGWRMRIPSNKAQWSHSCAKWPK